MVEGKIQREVVCQALDGANPRRIGESPTVQAGLECIWRIDDDRGVIEWRRGSGDNVELTYLRSREPRRGYGKALFLDMLVYLITNPPYCTIYGFTRLPNLAARTFYERMGFVTTEVSWVYKEGMAVVFSRPYKSLLLLHQLGHLLSPGENPDSSDS